MPFCSHAHTGKPVICHSRKTLCVCEGCATTLPLLQPHSSRETGRGQAPPLSLGSGWGADAPPPTAHWSRDTSSTDVPPGPAKGQGSHEVSKDRRDAPGRPVHDTRKQKRLRLRVQGSQGDGGWGWGMDRAMQSSKEIDLHQKQTPRKAAN